MPAGVLVWYRVQESRKLAALSPSPSLAKAIDRPERAVGVLLMLCVCLVVTVLCLFFCVVVVCFYSVFVCVCGLLFVL